MLTSGDAYPRAPVPNHVWLFVHVLEGLTGTKALDREAAGPLENGIEHSWLVLSSKV